MSRLASIILAAGKGTRMRSGIPKVLHKIAGDPMLFYPVLVADRLGCEKTVVVLGHGMDEVREAFRSLSMNSRLHFVQQNRQLGTADAVKAAQSQLNKFLGHVLILYGDVPLITQGTLHSFLGFHRQGGQDLSLLTTVLEHPKGYGRVIRNDSDLVVEIVEEIHADARQKRIKEINSGIYLLHKNMLFHELPKIKKNTKKKEYYLTDLVNIVARQGGRVRAMCVDHPFEVMGINDRAELAQANYFVRDRINLEWMEKGVTFVDPAGTYVDRAVKLSRDVTIGPGCVLKGRTVIRSGSRVDAGSLIVDSRIDANVHIKAYSVIESSHVGSGAQIGPFAHLRPDSRIGKEARIGNFVETKKTQVGKGAKANHLSYLGNAIVGEGSNVGAGTITCNYDGFNKSETRIGPRSFIGSNTELVAPVKLGADSWVGAGSTITNNVPSGALALSRVEQVNIKNWTHRRKELKGGRGARVRRR